MSDSYKKHVFSSNAVMNHTSLKKDRQRANRDLRRKTKDILREIKEGTYEEDDYIDLNVEDVSNRWTFRDDGRSYISEDSDFYEKAKRK